MTILTKQDIPTCSSCNEAPAAKHGISKLGYQRYRSVCHWCHKNKRPHLNYRSHKKDTCEECGFVAKHRCQLDVDHLDGDHNNNSTKNLITLCANCHRLKTHLNGESANIEYRK